MPYVDDIVAGLGANEYTLAGAPPRPWATGAAVTMGYIARGDNIPAWFDSVNYRDGWWRSVLPWWVIYPATGAGSTNSRVNIEKIVAYYKSIASGQWVKYGEWTGQQCWADEYEADLTTWRRTAPFRNEAGGARSFKLSGYPIHGGGAHVTLPAEDVANVRVSVIHQLIVDDPGLTDDRASGGPGLQAGKDFYVYNGQPASDFKRADGSSVGYVPGAGYSRFERSTSTRRATSWVPLRPPGVTAGTTPYLAANGANSTTVAEATFRADPGPDPLAGSTPAPTPTPTPTPAPIARVALKTTASGRRAVVSKAAIPLSITTTAIPAGTVGTAYSYALGGVGVASWSGSGLPPGLTITGGAINGTPTVSGLYSVTLRAFDAAGASVTATLPMRVSDVASTQTAGVWAAPLRTRKARR